jgi:hypothetical protein
MSILRIPSERVEGLILGRRRTAVGLVRLVRLCIRGIWQCMISRREQLGDCIFAWFFLITIIFLYFTCPLLHVWVCYLIVI